MRFLVILAVSGMAATSNAQTMQTMRPQTQVLNPWEPDPSMQPSAMRPPPARVPGDDPHVGSVSHFPYVILNDSNVLDPFLDQTMSPRERELLLPIRRVRARIARCVRDGRGIVRYQLRLRPTRVRRGRGASCLTRVLRGVSLPGRGTYELALNFAGEDPVGVYVVDRSVRGPRHTSMSTSMRAARPPTPPRPRLACRAPALQGAVRRTGDDEHFPDFIGMRAEAVHRHRTGPIAEAACRGLHNEVLNPWSRRDARTGAPNAFERDWARRVRQRKVLILACIPSGQRPESWALSFQVGTDGTVQPLAEATARMARCIQARISAPPQAYRLLVNFGESPEELYVDTR